MSGQQTPEGIGDLWLLAMTRGTPPTDLRFGAGEFIIGSAREADLRLRHPTVSRRHARIVASEGQVSVEDLGSANGTRVDGRPVDGPVRVRNGAVVELGEVELVLARMEGVQPTATPDRPEPARRGRELLGATTIGFLRTEGEEVGFGKGDVIIRRGQRQGSFYVVVDGEVEIFLQEGSSSRRPLARLGPGATFGTESVLADEGAAVDAVALCDVLLLRYPASALDAALKESSSLRAKLLGGIARHLHEATEDALDLLRGTEVITRLVQGDDEPDELVVASARMRAVEKKIELCAARRTPVLILGEAGTGKTLAARLIHSASPRARGPLIAVACRQLDPARAAELILGGEGAGRPGVRAHGSGGIHFASGGTLILRDVDALPAEVQRVLAGYFVEREVTSGGSFPNTRIIATARSAAGRTGSSAGLDPALLRCFGEVIQMLTLAERPRDILPLAEAMLDRAGPEAPRLTETARHALLAMRYRRNNVAELRDVVDLAVRVTDSPEIRAEHIFGAVGDEGAVPGVDVTGSPLVRTLSRPFVLKALRSVTAVGFAAVIVLCLVLAASPSGQWANRAIWSVWEPVVFGLFLVVGPVWCTVCPLSFAGRGVKRWASLNRPPPEWLMRHGPWLAIAGFALIVWSERVFRMTDNPLPSGVLLAALVVAAVAFGLVYRREVWCRHLCPLGRLAVALAPASPVQLTARRSICASSCQTHECYKGSSSIPGCTVFHHPLEVGQAHHCKLCMDCLQSCPHGSVGVQVRAPLRAIWSLDGSSSPVALFGFTVTLLALALLLPARVPALDRAWPFTLACCLALLAGLGLHRAATRLVADGGRDPSPAARVGFAFMVLGWGALMASQMASLPLLAESRVVLGGSGEWLPRLPRELPLLLLGQVAVVVASCMAALFTLRHIRLAAELGGGSQRRWGWRTLQVVVLAYALAAVYLVV